MKNTLFTKISDDLKESQINWKVMVIFIPIAFLTYLFHESGHWTLGELLGNNMTIALNNSAPRSGYFIKQSHAIWSAIGGPLFTIIQGLIFLFITWKTKSIIAYSFTFFAFFSRFFSIVFGGFDLQDEARIALMLGWNKYLVAIITLSILFVIIWKCGQILKLNLKAVGYFFVLGVGAILLVIGVNELLSIR